jgi:hypothetical protein
MKTTVSVYDFRDAFQSMGRGKQFSYEGLGVLFDYFEQLEDDCGMEIELDPIAICCEYSELEPMEIAEQYGIPMLGVDFDDEDDVLDMVENFLQVNGAFIGTTEQKTIVFQQY